MLVYICCNLLSFVIENRVRYPPAVKRGNWKFTRNGGFNMNTSNHVFSSTPCLITGGKTSIFPWFSYRFSHFPMILTEGFPINSSTTRAGHRQLPPPFTWSSPALRDARRRAPFNFSLLLWPPISPSDRTELDVSKECNHFGEGPRRPWKTVAGRLGELKLFDLLCLTENHGTPWNSSRGCRCWEWLIVVFFGVLYIYVMCVCPYLCIVCICVYKYIYILLHPGRFGSHMDRWTIYGKHMHVMLQPVGFASTDLPFWVFAAAIKLRGSSHI